MSVVVAIMAVEREDNDNKNMLGDDADETRQDGDLGTIVGGIGDFFAECFENNGVAGVVVCPALSVAGGLTALICLLFCV